VHGIKISFIRNDATDTPLRMHVSPQDEAYMVLVRIVLFAIGRVVSTPSRRVRGHPLGIADPADIC